MLALAASLGASPAAAQDVAALRAAAAEVAVSVASMTAAAGAPGPIAVQEFTGPPDRAALLTRRLRAELLRGGAVVAAPDGPADYDLRGALLGVGSGWLLSAELWRRSAKTLVGTAERDVADGPPAPGAPAKAVPAAPARKRSFWLTGGLAGRKERQAWSVGAAYRPASRRWEAGVDGGAFDSAVWSGSLAKNPYVHVAFSFVQARAAYLHWVDRKYVSYLRAGLGARWLRMSQESGLGTPQNFEERSRLQPVVELGAAKSLWGDIELDVRGEWTPTVRTIGGMTTGGFSALALLGFRLPV